MDIKKLFISLMIVVFPFCLFAQETRTLYVDKAGTLISLFTEEEANSITDLTITGKINAIDFKHLRDEFNKLETLDLSNVSISAYAGKEGTHPDNFYIYRANYVPAYAFCKVENGTEKGKLSLKKVILSEKTKNIEDAAFKRCDNLRVCQIRKKTPPNLLKDALSDTITAIFVPLGSTEEYRQKKTWSGFAFVEDEPLTVHVEIGSMESLESVLQRNGIQPKNINFLTIEGKMDNQDFKLIRDYMPNLITLNIFNTTATVIPEFSFAQKNYLLRIELPKELKIIKERAFSGCGRLSGSLELPATLTTIEYGAFIGCDKLSKVIARGNKVTAIGENLFGEGKNRLVFD